MVESSLASTESELDAEIERFGRRESESEIETDEEVRENTLKNSQQKKAVDENSEICENAEARQISSDGESPEEESKRAARKARRKDARNIRFNISDSDIQLDEKSENPIQLQTEVKVSNEVVATASSSTQTSTNHLECKDTTGIDVFFDEEDDEDDEDEDGLLKTTKEDTIKAKMEFLNFFEIPSLSDISEDKKET
ncbi:transcriptional regulator ATRX homolog [Drosophila virilis]|uniref:Uncharacterized protein n=1 Tax=Drosophila virilis TaxID=7244 RepID=B4LLZ6_DROVI|nr:uncharacterized protein Dvir_GJ21199 [Drosophila virilis]